MRLKGKIFTVLITVILTITLSYYIVFRLVILQSFMDLEKEDARNNMQRCTATLDRELRNLNRFAHDWAAWDDTYQFVLDRNQEFIKSNISFEILRDQRLNLILIYDLEGRLVQGLTMDLKTGKEIPLDLARELGHRMFVSLTDQKKTDSSTTGIIRTRYGPMMITSNPILTSAVTGPSRGALMMGRLVTDEVIGQISEQVDVRLSALEPGEAAHNRGGTVPVIQGPGGIVLREENRDTISAYAVIRDIGGTPAFTLHADMPRKIMKKGMDTYVYGFLFILGGGLLLLLFVGSLVQLLVLAPLSRLSSSIIAIGEGQDRMDDGLAGRKDELGTLSQAFTGMLQKLKEREHTLWLGEQRLRQIIDAVPHSIFSKDENGRYILANRAFADLMGRRVKDVIGMTDIDLMIDQADAEHYRKVDMEVLESGEQKLVPAETITDAMGRVRILQTTKIPFTFSGTTARAVLGVSVDITEIKKAEDALKESERRLSDIINFLPDATFAIDLEGRVIAWNLAMEELSGVAKEDILGKDGYTHAIPLYGERRPLLLDLIVDPHEDAGRHYDFVNTAGDTLIAETYLKRAYGGKGAYIWAAAARLYDSAGNVSGAIECMRDITVRKKDEELLMHQRAIIEQSLDGILMADLEGVIVYANPAAGELFGCGTEQLLGQNMSAFHTKEQYLTEVAPLIEGVRTHGRSTGMVSLLRKDGSSFNSLVTLFILKDHKNNSVAIIGMVRDISEEVRMERQLRQAQKMEVIGQLAGGVAHDLNNLLSPILGYTEMILQGVTETDPTYHGLFQVLTAADRARKLTRQLLAFGSKQVLEVKVVDLSEVVQSYSKMIRRTIREDIEIRITSEPPLPGVLVDTDQIGQILMNLTLNAQDAMPAGGVITIGTAPDILDEAYAATHQGVKPGPYVRLTVSDTGMGMDRETLDHIFEPFFTTKDRGKGTGLGLATVYGIVTQHKGHVHVYSEQDTGTTFRIYLPRAEGVAEKLSSRVDIGKGKRGKETVIVAEDDEGVRLLTCEILQNHGYRVISAADTNELLRLIDAEEGSIDLMVTDVIMPGLNGKQLYERIRAGHAEMRVLYMSGYTGDVIDHHGILDKGVNFIQKPFSIQGITSKVRQVLDA